MRISLLRKWFDSAPHVFEQLDVNAWQHIVDTIGDKYQATSLLMTCRSLYHHIRIPQKLRTEWKVTNRLEYEVKYDTDLRQTTKGCYVKGTSIKHGFHFYRDYYDYNDARGCEYDKVSYYVVVYSRGVIQKKGVLDENTLKYFHPKRASDLYELFIQITNMRMFTEFVHTHLEGTRCNKLPTFTWHLVEHTK